jgi:UPF0755 protein
MRYRHHNRSSAGYIPRRLLFIGAALLIVLVAAVIGVRVVYNKNLGPVSNSQQTQIITVASGSSTKQIAKQLAEQKLIRNAWTFEWYVHSMQLGNKLQAGTYAFSPSTSIPQIADVLTKGRVATKLVTILPGRRIDQVRADLINDGFSIGAVDAALNPANYRSLPVMQYAPANVASLEGLLFPDSYQRTDTTDPNLIITESLKKMGTMLPAERQAAYAREGLNVYQALTLASIVEREVSKQSDREQVAQVFLSRLQKGMSLGSDPTATYGAILAGKSPSLTFDSPYNTRIKTGLPPGPIGSVSESSLKALANPASTDWLYFVSGDDGVTYFSKTLQEHEQNTRDHCKELCKL